MLSIAPLFNTREFFPQFPAYHEKWNSDYDFNEDEKFYSLSLDLPGLKKEDIAIDLVEKKISIAGTRKRSGEEFKFTKNFVLPEFVDVEKIEATYEDGVLWLKLAKLATAQPRKIEIKG